MNGKEVIIIGAGAGGLFTGALLAKEGYRVTVLEKNAVIGGGLQSFRRFGEVFDTGMHVIGGLREGGNVWKICRYLGILEEVCVKDVDDDCCDEIRFGNDERSYRLCTGREGFIDSVARYFPEERDGIAAYVDAILEMAGRIALFNLRPFEGFGRGITEDMIQSADGFIASYVKDEKLRSLLSYMNPLYGGRRDETPAYIHAIIQTLYIKGASRFVDGSVKFAETLRGYIESQGGEVISGEGVERIEVEGKMVQGVVTTRGRRFEADYYISDVHPCELLRLMPEGGFPKSYRTRLEEIPNSYSAFSVYIKFKDRNFPYINHSVYYMNDWTKIWDFGKEEEEWPMGFLFMTPPTSRSDEYATTALVTVPMAFGHVLRWEGTKCGNRGTEYEEWKERQTEAVVSLLEKLYPGIREKIENINSASPLTIRDFYNAKGGGISGYSKDYKNLALSQLPVVTKVKNLYLTGQNNNLPGLCGVALTAINTAEAITGINHIVEKINEGQ